MDDKLYTEDDLEREFGIMKFSVLDAESVARAAVRKKERIRAEIKELFDSDPVTRSLGITSFAEMDSRIDEVRAARAEYNAGKALVAEKAGLWWAVRIRDGIDGGEKIVVKVDDDGDVWQIGDECEHSQGDYTFIERILPPEDED